MPDIDINDLIALLEVKRTELGNVKMRVRGIDGELKPITMLTTNYPLENGKFRTHSVTLQIE